MSGKKQLTTKCPQCGVPLSVLTPAGTCTEGPTE
jgi:uncharacterized Zn finger protein (UPF0148 family)